MSWIRETTWIVIENGIYTEYRLDDKTGWEVGRAAGQIRPDIDLHAPTVSRQQGKLRNAGGIWFYVEHRGKNGTFRNGRQITAGVGGMVKPQMLEHGDVMIFGAGKEPVINSRTVWTLFLERRPKGACREEYIGDLQKICVQSGAEQQIYSRPAPGSVIETEYGLAICMGEMAYLLGDISVTKV